MYGPRGQREKKHKKLKRTFLRKRFCKPLNYKVNCDRSFLLAAQTSEGLISLMSS